MDPIRLAIQRLETSPTVKKAQKVDRAVDDAVSQLSSTATLLELSTPSSSTLTKLTVLLRGRLLPLYRISFTLTLDYALSIFHFIHQNKLLGNKKAETRRPWENILESLFSGTLDFLEDNPTGKFRDNLASTLYPVLCPVFFSSLQGSHEEFDGNLLSTIYQLLLTTVDSNPKNGAKLRDTHIGSGTMGSTIYRTKDILALESLLDLFAVLIPPIKAGREKRSQFIKEVFSPSIFSCSDEIIRCLENISDPDWSITSAKIMKTLAESHISFPQPLVVGDFTLNGEKMNVSTFFVDKSKFVANIDIDGKIETLHVPFSTLQKTSASLSSNDAARILAVTTKPPIMGDTSIQTSVDGDHTISWNIERKLLERFRKAVISRGLTVDLSARQKQSKAEEITLDFLPNNQAEKKTPSTWRKEKVESLSQLWNAAVPSREDRETSPLVPSSELKSNLKSWVAVPETPGFLEKSKNDAVFIHPNGNLSYEPKEPLVVDLSKGNSPAKNSDPRSDDSTENIRPSKSKFSSRKRVLSLTDDEDEDDCLGSKDTINGSTSTLPIKNEERPLKQPQESITSHLAVKFAETVKTKPLSKKSKTVIHDENESSLEKTTDNSKKRKFEETIEKACVDEKINPSSKRQRLESPKDLAPSSPRKPPKNRYGRSGNRTSSPRLAEVDFFDEVPHSTRTSEPRVSRMKDKAGKAMPSKQAVPESKKEKKRRTNTKKRGRKSVETDPDVTLVEIEKEKSIPVVVPVKEEKRVIARRVSARTSVIEKTSKPKAEKDISREILETTSKSKPKKFSIDEEATSHSKAKQNTVANNEILGATSKPKSEKEIVTNNIIETTSKLKPKTDIIYKKSQQAPWEMDDFLMKQDLSSSNDMVVDPEPTSNVSNEHEKSEPVQPSSDDITSEAKEYTDETETVGIETLNSPPSKSALKVVTIDLTGEDSPPVVKTPVVKKTQRTPKVTVLTRLLEKRISRHTKELEPARDPSDPPAVECIPQIPVAEDLPEEKRKISRHRQELKEPIQEYPRSPVVNRASKNAVAETPSVENIGYRQPLEQPIQDFSENEDLLRPYSPKTYRKSMPTVSPQESRPRHSKVVAVETHHTTPLEVGSRGENKHKRQLTVNFALPEDEVCSYTGDKGGKSRKIVSTDHRREKGPYSRGNSSPHRSRPKQEQQTYRAESPESDPMAEIASILRKINEAVIHNVERRFDEVTETLNEGQRAIIEETVEALEEMFAESGSHVVGLMALETKYRAACAKIVQGVHDYHKSTEQASKAIKDILLERSARSLCKQFPAKLVPRIPAIFLDAQSK